jgi:hypothetical protein
MKDPTVLVILFGIVMIIVLLFGLSACMVLALH